MERPKLKLNLSKNKSPSQETSTSPALPSALRTPSIKLHVRPSLEAQAVKTSLAAQSRTRKKKDGALNGVTPSSSGRKRKQREEVESEDELARKPAQVRKLTLTTKPPVPQSPITPTLKFKYKGRIPKRPLGLGYDSELDDREADPTILETFVLRMPSGADCDYLRDAIEHGAIGVARSQGGADVQMKFFERSGRRGMITIRGQRWATILVDLPCIVEGMKSWDKKAWVKGADICQMLLVLGQVQNDDQAQSFPLPNDVDLQTWQYAHGLTPPMRWVRKRRFARTKRTSVSAIEAVERKVNQLLAEDELAVHTRYDLLDHDPAARPNSDYTSAESDNEGGEQYYEEEDAEGEEDNDGYVGQENAGLGHVTTDVPTAVDSQPHEDQDADDDFILSALMETADQPTTADTNQTALDGLPPPSADSSIAIASTSPSVAETMAQTPAAVENARAGDYSDDMDEEEDEDEDEEVEDESMDDEDREATAQKQKALDEIQELKEELKKQTLLLKSQQNPILARKIRARMEQIEGDLETARKTAGLDGDGEDGEED